MAAHLSPGGRRRLSLGRRVGADIRRRAAAFVRRWTVDIAADRVDHGASMMIVDETDQQALDQHGSGDTFQPRQHAQFENEVAMHPDREPFGAQVVGSPRWSESERSAY